MEVVGGRAGRARRSGATLADTFIIAVLADYRTKIQQKVSRRWFVWNSWRKARPVPHPVWDITPAQFRAILQRSVTSLWRGGSAPQAIINESAASELHRQDSFENRLALGPRDDGSVAPNDPRLMDFVQLLDNVSGRSRFPNGTDGRPPVQALFGRRLLPVHRMLPPPHPRSGRMCPLQGQREGLGMAAMKPQGNAAQSSKPQEKKAGL